MSKVFDIYSSFGYDMNCTWNILSEKLKFIEKFTWQCCNELNARHSIQINRNVRLRCLRSKWTYFLLLLNQSIFDMRLVSHSDWFMISKVLVTFLHYSHITDELLINQKYGSVYEPIRLMTMMMMMMWCAHLANFEMNEWASTHDKIFLHFLCVLHFRLQIGKTVFCRETTPQLLEQIENCMNEITLFFAFAHSPPCQLWHEQLKIDPIYTVWLTNWNTREILSCLWRMSHIFYSHYLKYINLCLFQLACGWKIWM